MPALVSSTIRIIGKEVVDAKLLMAAPRILAQNKLMIGEMLSVIRNELIAETPLGPGHFGYHLRDSYTIDVAHRGAVNTAGVLKAPAQGYWREYGTKGRFKGPKGSRRRSYTAAIGGFGEGGEPALMLAHKAYEGVRKVISFYYGGMAAWWRF